MDIQLSSDSDALICVLYAEYLNRRNHGVSIDESRSFPDDETIHRDYLPDWLPEDIYTVCIWLSEKGLLRCFAAEEHILEMSFTEDGIIYMETRFARKRESVIAHITELVKLGVSVAPLFLH